MTYDWLYRTEKEMLTPADIAPILGADPQTIRLTAKLHPEWIGYPYTFCGNRMRIPRTGFLNWLTGKKGGETT